MKIKVQCTAKNERLEGTNTAADITLSPNSNNNFAVGAAIGTPNAPSPAVANNLQQEEQIVYTLNGALSFTVKDSDESARFKVGNIYELSVNVVEEKKK